MNPLGGIANRELVSIDIGQTNLRIAYARAVPNAKEVLALLSQDINGLSDDDIAKAVRAFIERFKLKNPQIMNLIPTQQIITKNIEIPSTNPQEISDIVNLQAGRHTPFSREEIIVDYIVIGTFKNSYTKILLVITARSAIKRQFDILNKAGIKLEKVAFLSEALAVFIPRTLRLNAENAPVGILHIDESFSNFTVSFKNKPIFVRNIPIGAQHIIEGGEGSQLKCVEEIQKSLESYQSEDIEKNPHELVVTGATEELKGLEGVLNSNLHIPSRVVSPYQNVAISNSAMQTAAAAKRCSFLTVIAPLFTWEGLKIDLVPEEIKLRKAVEERARALIKTGILTLTAFVLIFSILVGRIYFKSLYLGKLKKEYDSYHQEAQKLEANFTKISLVKNYLINRGYSLEVLAELYAIVPQDMMINDIKFDVQDKFSVKGTAESMSTVFSFVDSMEKTKYFKDVKTRYTTKRKEDSKDVTDFEVIAVLEK